MKKFNYDLLFSEIKRKGFTYKAVAEALKVDPNTISLKKTGKGSTRELTGTQIAIICDMLRSPLDMFVIKGADNEKF